MGSFFGAPPLKASVGGVFSDAVKAAGVSSTVIPTVAPPYWNELDGKPHPIILWMIGPYAQSEVGSDQVVGWCYDAAGHWWRVYGSSFRGIAGSLTSPGVGDVDGKNVYRGQNGYAFQVMIGPPVSGGDSFISQVGQLFVKEIIPIAIGILTIVQPEIGIAAALVYSKVAMIAAGAPLSTVVFSTMSDAAKSQIPSTTGKGLFDQGVSAAGDLAQVKAARDKVNALGSVAAEALGLKKSFESGLAIGQSKLIQKRAIELIRAQLPSDYDRAVLDTAIDQGAAIADVALGMFPSQAEGAARLNNAVAQATVEVDPAAKSIVKTVVVPVTPVAQSGKPLSSSGSSGSKGGGGGGSGPGLGTVAAVGVGGFFAWRWWKSHHR